MKIQNHLSKRPVRYALALSILAGIVVIKAVNLTAPSVSSGEISFTYDSGADQLMTVQQATSPTGTWSDVEWKRGTGGVIQFKATANQTQRFFRVKSTVFQSLDLSPAGPTLQAGAISLEDSVVGNAYSGVVSIDLKGVPPYTLQTGGNTPAGISLTVKSNGTANAAVEISGTGQGLVAGQRRQFTVSATDAAGTVVARTFDLRVIAPPPSILTSQLTMKAGVAVDSALSVSDGEGALAWEIVSGAPPEGVLVFGTGRVTGTPTAAAAELGEVGLHSTVLKVADSLTDRVTGAPTPRSATRSVSYLVRLSLQLNLLNARPGGPGFGGICFSCHGPGFGPEVNSAVAMINVPSQGEFFPCSDRIYVVPGNPQNSLLLQKLGGPDCGDRMPQGGPFYSAGVLSRVERWIRELTPQDTD